MDNAKKDYHVSDDVAAHLQHLAARLRPPAKADHLLSTAILELIEEAARSERIRMSDALLDTAPAREERVIPDDLPF